MVTKGVNDKWIEWLGKRFDKWATDTGTIVTNVQNITVKPGKFKDADDLKTAVENAVKSLVTNLNNDKAAFTATATTLHQAATDYNRGEEENKITAEFTTLDKTLDEKLPGLSKDNKTSE